MFKKLTVTGLAMLFVMGGAFCLKAEDKAAPAEKVAVQTKKIADWIEVTAPESAKVGETVKIKVKLTGVPDGCKLAGDMHFFRGPSYGGFLVWHRPQTVKAGKEYTFKYKIPEKEGMSSVGVLFYYGKKGGWGNKEKDAWFKFINIE